jgi:hypothetical protein
LSSNSSLLDSLDTVISLIEKIKQNRRVDQAAYNTLLVLYITIMVLGGVGNMAIIFACFRNKVGSRQLNQIHAMKLLSQNTSPLN